MTVFILLAIGLLLLLLLGCVLAYVRFKLRRRNLNVYSQPKLPD